jgi:ATP-dependent Clp protease ATP-binding subunit ClpC
MKRLLLPHNLLKFWYVDGARLWWRLWKNTITYLEESLGVGIMWHLLFTPLFHDFSIVGRAFSFIFRLCRVGFGLVAYFIVTLLLALVALYWFFVPILLIFSFFNITLITTIHKLVFLLGLFLYFRRIRNPALKLSQVKKADHIWQASRLKPHEIHFVTLLKHPNVVNLLTQVELKTEQFVPMTQISLQTTPQVVQQAVALAQQVKSDYIEAEHFFLGFLLTIPQSNQFLAQYQVTLEDLTESLVWQAEKREQKRTYSLWNEKYSTKHLKGTNRGWLGVPTPSLDRVVTDLTHQASMQSQDDFVGREDTVEQLIRDLSLEKGRNVIIVGDTGTGKTTLVQHLACLIVRGDAPASLATKRLVSLELPKLLSGVTSEGVLAERIKTIFEEVQYSGQIILFIDEIHTLGLAEAGAQYNLYGLLQPYLESSTFQFIGATESGNFAKVIEKNTAFSQLFHRVDLPTANAEETLKILKRKSIQMEPKVYFSLPALHECVSVAMRYMHSLVLPASAVRLFSESIGAAQNGWVTKEIVDQLAGQLTHVPIAAVSGAKTDQLLHLEEIIHQQYIDQEEAVTAIATSLRRSAANLRETNRPIGSFLFVGPTGVGKTELAKILSQIYFSGSMHRLDMSEYQAEDSINKLIGGAGERGEVTEFVRQSPYCLLLLDELEKAHPKILTLFLQVLDDGRLTDGTGETVDFTNTIIIATSNAGSIQIAQGVSSGIPIAQVKQTLDAELLRVFKPEFINRFDQVVMFKPLASQHLEYIVTLKLKDLQQKLKDQGIMVRFSQDLITSIAQRGFDPIMGARPLRRLIQDTLEAKLATLILENKIPKGQEIVIDSSIL